MSEEPVSGNFWTSWGLPLLIVAALVAVCGAALSASVDIPLWQGLAWGVVLAGGFGAFFFGEFHLYAAAGRRLGFRCEMRPSPKPRSAWADADIVISGTFRGRPFTLYRDGKNSSSTSASSATRAASRVVYSVVEWIDEGIRLPSFTLQLGSPFDPSSTSSQLEKISMPMVSAMRGSQEVEPSSADFGSGTKLGGRSTLSGPDAGAARALFSHIVCEALDPLVDHGRVEAEPGLLVLRELPTSDLWTSRKGKFPYPWEIEEYLEHADQVRRVFVT